MTHTFEDYTDGEVHEMYFSTNSPEEVEQGDILGTTTSKFKYDALTCNFENNLTGGVLVTAQHIEEDYSEFQRNKSRNGGCYGFDFYEVLEILRVDPGDNEVYIPDNTGYTPSPFEITGEELEKLTDEEIKEMEEI